MIKSVSVLFTIVFFFLTVNTVKGQKFYFKQYTTEDGLNGDNVYDLHIDHLGRLLIATDKGLNLLNGNSFYALTHQSSYFGLHKVDSLIYGLTYGDGLKIIQKNDSITPFKSNALLKKVLSSPIYGITKNHSTHYLSSYGEIWVGEKGNLKRIYSVPYKNIKELNRFSVVFQKNKPGALLIHNTRKMEDTFAGFQVMNFPFFVGRSPVFDVRHGHYDTTHYFGLGNVIHTSNRDSWSLKKTLGDEFISAIHPTDQEILIGTYEGKVYTFNFRTKKIKQLFSSTHQTITAIRKDHINNVWVSTEGGGIFKINTSLERVLPQIPIRATEIFFTPYDTFYVLSQKLVQAHTHEQVRSFVPVQIQTIKRLTQQKNTTIRTRSFNFFLKTPDSLFLGCYYAGIDKYKQVNDTFLKGQYSRRPNRFFSGDFIDSNWCLLGCHKGLFRYNYRKELRFEQTEIREDSNFESLECYSLNSKRINAIKKIRSGSFLIGTHDTGLFFLNLMSAQRPQKLKCVKQTHIADIFEILPNYFLVNSEKQVSVIKHIEGAKFKLISTLKLPLIRNIYHKKDDIYFLTNNGIFRINVTRLIERHPIHLNLVQEHYAFKFSEKTKKVHWNCSVTDIEDNNDLYRVLLIKDKDTQIYFTSLNFFDLKGFAYGNYKAVINVNPELGGMSNDITFLIELKPPLYLSNTAKGIYTIALLILISLIIYTVTRFYRLKFQSQSERANLELAAVRNVLKPHYLHNTLNTLQSIAYFKDFEKLNSYVTKLSKWLRLSLKDNDHQIISLEKELKLITSFLELEKMKLEFGLKYLIRDETAADAKFQVPFFILQPIIENTLKYSFLKSTNPRLTIQVSGNKEQLRILIMDNGHGLQINNEKSTKTGLSIIRRKLELYDILTRSSALSTYQIKFDKGKGTLSEIFIYQPYFEQK